MFKDTKEGSTHHDKDACYKCKICNAHVSIQDQFTTQMCDECLKIEIKNWKKEIKEYEKETK